MTHCKVVLYLLFFCFAPFYMMAQEEEPSPAVQAFERGMNMSRTNIDSGISILEEGVTLAFAEQDSFMAYRIHFYIGTLNIRQSNFLEALDHLYLAKAFNLPKQDFFVTNSIEIEIGKAYGGLKEFDKALGCFTRALSYFETQSDAKSKYNVAGLHSHMGNLYDLMNDFPHSVHEHKESMKMGKEIGDTLLIQFASKGLALEYLKMSHDSAQFYIDQTRELCRLKPENRIMTALELTVGKEKSNQGNYEEAKKSFYTAINLYPKLQNLSALSEGQIHLGEAFLGLNQVDSALIVLKQGLTISEEHGYLENCENGHMFLSNLYEKTGKPSKAYHHLVQSFAFKDSLYKKSNLLEIGRLEGMYQVRLNEREMACQQQEIVLMEEKEELATKSANLSYIIASLMLVFLIAGGGVFIGRQKQNKLILTQERKLGNVLKESLSQKEDEAINLVSAITLKNELLEKVQDAIQGALKKSDTSEVKGSLKSLALELKQFENRDKETQRIFDLGGEIQKSFLVKLKSKYDLTENDLKLSTLVCLNLSTKETSSVLNKSTKAVEMAKYRLKKKLDLKEGTDLGDFIRGLN